MRSLASTTTNSLSIRSAWCNAFSTRLEATIKRRRCCSWLKFVASTSSKVMLRKSQPSTTMSWPLHSDLCSKTCTTSLTKWTSSRRTEARVVVTPSRSQVQKTKTSLLKVSITIKLNPTELTLCLSFSDAQANPRNRGEQALHLEQEQKKKSKEQQQKVRMKWRILCV